MSNTRPVAAAATHTAPGMSKRSRRPLMGAARQITGSASNPATGRTRVHRQPPAASNTPPSTGPRALNTAAALVTRPNAPALVVPSQRVLIRVMPRTGTAAAPMPCRILLAINTGNVGAVVATSAPAAMSTTPMTRGPRTPTMSAIRPCTAVSTARATAYPLITQAALAVPTPRPAASSGSATDTADVPVPASPNNAPMTVATRPAVLGSPSTPMTTPGAIEAFRAISPYRHSRAR